MSELPWHPALVHLPLGVAPAVLMAGVAASVAVWRGWAPRDAWWVPASLQGLVVIGVFAARWAGENDAEGLWEVVGEQAIHDHNSWANGFSIVSVVTLVLLIGAAVAREPRASSGLGALGVLCSGVMVWFGIQTGHSGGELVWNHGAAHHHYEQHHRTSKALEEP